MTVRPALLLPFLLTVLAAPVRADALPNCPPGTHMVTNPTPPGAMHHGGAHCAPDEPPANPVPPTAPVVDPLPPPVVAPAVPPPAPVAPPPPPAAAPAPASTTGMCSATPGRTAGSPILGIALALVLAVASRRR